MSGRGGFSSGRRIRDHIRNRRGGTDVRYRSNVAMIGPKRDGRGSEQRLQAVSVYCLADRWLDDGSDAKDESDVEGRWCWQLAVAGVA